MELKNYQEDVVLHIIYLVLKDRPKVKADEDFINDVAAFTLNRIKPRYIMSERGFYRFAKDYHLEGEGKFNDNLRDLIQIVSVVNNAIDIVHERRKNNEKNKNYIEHSPEFAPPLTEMMVWHNFPHIIGKVADMEDNKPIENVKVTFYLNGKKVKAADRGWSNPCHTSVSTEGYYNFWPKSLQHHIENLDSEVKIKFSHNKYKLHEITKTVNTKGSFQCEVSIRNDNILHIEPVLLVKKS